MIIHIKTEDRDYIDLIKATFAGYVSCVDRCVIVQTIIGDLEKKEKEKC